MAEKNKKGTISVDFLITLILLVVGFIVLLIFFYNVGGVSTMDKTVCHNSVIFRATLPSLFEGYMPLKCKSKKICVTSGFLSKGECEAFIGETGVSTVRVKSGSDGEIQIAQLYAQEMLDCWEMMGEGKVSLFSQWMAQTYGFGSVYPSCMICSRIAFDKKKLDENNVNLSNVDIQGYMVGTKPSGKNVSYLSYILGEDAAKVSTSALNLGGESAKTLDANDIMSSFGLDTTQANKVLADINNVKTNIGDAYGADVSPQRVINFSKDSTAILFMQITSPRRGETFGNFLGTAGALLLGTGAQYNPRAFFNLPTLTKTPAVSAGIKIISTPPVYTSASELVVGQVAKTAAIPARYSFVGKVGTKPLFWAVVAALVATGVGQQMNVAWQRSATAGKCGDISIGTEARNGCTVIRAIPYEPDMISTYCGVVESIP